MRSASSSVGWLTPAAHDWLLSGDGVKTKYAEKFSKYLERMKLAVAGAKLEVGLALTQSSVHKITAAFAKNEALLKTLILRGEEFYPDMRKGVFSVIIELLLFEAASDSPYVKFFASHYEDLEAFLLEKWASLH